MNAQTFRHKKHLGQHFLADNEILRHEAELLSPEGKDVLEIGAGDGRLSRMVFALKPSSLTLLEIDRELCSLLRKNYSPFKEVTICEGDAMDFVRALPNASKKYKLICGNIPYQISGPLFASLSRLEFERGVFCVQKEVAERLAANPGSSDFGRLSLAVQLRYSVRISIAVPKGLFDPPPKVDSSIIVIEPLKKKERISQPENFEQVCTQLFSHRLQSVANAIYHSRAAFGMGKEEAREIAKTIKYRDEKVFCLDAEQICEIARQLGKGR